MGHRVRRWAAVFGVWAVSTAWWGGAWTWSAPSPTAQAWGDGLPLSFERNVGQADARVAYLARTPGYALSLTATGAVFALSSGEGVAIVRMEYVGGHPQSAMRGRDPLPGRVHYFPDRDSGRWTTGIPTYEAVVHDEVYSGIDLVYRSEGRRLEYDFLVEPGADPGQIALRFDGAQGVEVDAAGDLLIRLPAPWGALRHHRPQLYQEAGGQRAPVAGRYVQTGPTSVRFQVGGYDVARRLVIDPALSYSTYLGGGSDEFGGGIAVDAGGHVYVTGHTTSANFPITPGVYQTTGGGVWVAKLNPSGTTMLYATFIGNGIGRAIAVDSGGFAYVTGEAFSDFPVTPGAVQTVFGGGVSDVFVTKLQPDGSALVYSTLLGGFTATAPERESGTGIAVDASGSAYVTGYTSSGPDFVPNSGAGKFPVVHAFQEDRRGRSDAFLSVLDDSGSTLSYSTYFGGTELDAGNGIALDSSGAAYITGQASSPDLATTSGVFQTIRQGGSDAFVAKFDPFASGGASLLYGTYFGGGSGTQTFNHESGNGIAVNAAGEAFIAGSTSSSDLPVTVGAAQLDGGAFVAKFSTDAANLAYCTYADAGSALSINADGEAYITGSGVSIDKLNADGTAFLYHVPLGAGVGRGIAVDADGNSYATGETSSPAFPTTSGVAQSAYGGGGTDAFIAKVDESLISMGPVAIWVGLKNSDDVGIRFDLKAEIYRNGTQLLSSGELTSVAGGSSGFNNAKLRALNLPAISAGDLSSGDTLSLALWVRNACAGSGKNSGTARLWYNDAAANSRFEESLSGPTTQYLLTGSALGGMPGAGPKATVDVAAGAKCSPYKTFGTWSSVTVP